MLATMDDTYHRAGSGDPLVLLHGITGSWHVWKPVLPALEASYDVIATTLPGHLGRSWPTDRPRAMRDLADLVLEDLARLGVERPHLVGNSLGGWVALEVAARGAARSVTAFSPAGGWVRAREQERVGNLFQKMHATIAEAMPAAETLLANAEDRRRMMGVVLERGDLVPAEEARRMWQGVLAVDDLEGILLGLAEPELATVGAQTPHAIVWCGEDHLLTRAGYSEGWRRAAPHAEWTVLEGAGHVPMYDDPEGVVRAIETTIARTRG